MRVFKTFFVYIAYWMALRAIPALGDETCSISPSIITIPNIADADIGELNLQDGSIQDWFDVVDNPRLFASQLSPDPVGDGAAYDPQDFDFMVFLSWNRQIGRLYVGVVIVDDILVEVQDTDDLEVSDHTVILAVDGDRDGGEYLVDRQCCQTEEEYQSLHSRTAQRYVAHYQGRAGRRVQRIGPAREWLNAAEWAFGWGTVGESTFGWGNVSSVVEFYITPFDCLHRDSARESLKSELFWKKLISFDLAVVDRDDPSSDSRSVYSLSGAIDRRDSRLFVDALLYGSRHAVQCHGPECKGIEPICVVPHSCVGESGVGATAVETATWGMVKVVQDK